MIPRLAGQCHLQTSLKRKEQNSGVSPAVCIVTSLPDGSHARSNFRATALG